MRVNAIHQSLGFNHMRFTIGLPQNPFNIYTTVTIANSGGYTYRK